VGGPWPAYAGPMASLNIAITSDLDRAARYAGAMAKQMRYAASVALNNTAFDARGSVNSSTKQYLQEPVAFTQNAYRVQKATKATLTAVVYPEAKRRRYLRFAVHGGERPQKGFEKKFLGSVVETGQLPVGAQFMPTSLVKLTAAGNVSLATIRRIQAGLSTTNARGGFFVGTPRGGDRPPGIYRRSREQLFPYFIATSDTGSYTPRFPIDDVASKVVQRRFAAYYETALSRAIATAR
jgi:hypothetical protein